jgi:predicted ATPase/DNA-binding CsgD family transcriptional regulator
VAGSRPVRPGWATPFVGREREIDGLRRRLAEVRLLTLVGGPGVGKTRLCEELVRRLGDRGDRDEAGVQVVELAPLVDPALTAEAVAAVLGVPTGASRSAGDAIVESIGTQDLLLVLDNCEHVVDAVAALVSGLLTSCPSVQVLATSRIALDLSGEQIWRVPPLEIRDAVELFGDRARLTSPAAPLAERSPVVEVICRRLDGLPLAVELAAALTRVLSPEEILARLDQIMSLLRTPSRDVDRRHQTMEATIDWSYRLLGHNERLLFDQLSVFAGGFDLDAAQTVVRDADVFTGLTKLVDHSLVVTRQGVTGLTRYRLLEPLRRYADDRLVERGGRDTTRRRHAEHYLDTARRLDGDLGTARSGAALRRIEEDDGNFRVALDFALAASDDLGLGLCTALGRSWALRGRISEGRARLDEALKAETRDRRLRASALYRASRLAWRQHDNTETRRLLQESLAIEHELGEQVPGQRLRVARRLRGLGLVAMTEGDLDLAQRHLGDSVAICRALRAADDGATSDLSLALAFSALGLLLAGRIDEAEPYVHEAMELSRASGNIHSVLYSLGAAVFVAIIGGDTMHIRSHAVGFGTIIRELGGLDEDPSWLWLALAVASTEGRYRSALRLAGAIDAVARRDDLRFHGQFEKLLRPWLDRARARVNPVEHPRLAVEGSRLTLDGLIHQALGTSDSNDTVPLSPRELEIAELVAKGLDNGEIADRLVISKRTVETHVAHIKTKLGLLRRVEIVTWVVHGTAPDDIDPSSP